LSPYQPPFTFTNAIVASVAWTARSATTLSPKLRRGHRIQTIQASLAIEHNTLSIEQNLNIVLQENDGVNDEASDGVNINLDRLDQSISKFNGSKVGYGFLYVSLVG